MTSLNSLDYLIKNKIDNELDKITLIYLKMSIGYNGLKCKKCNVIQGQEHFGVRNYYCEHISNLIRRRLKKENKEIMKKVIAVIRIKGENIQ